MLEARRRSLRLPESEVEISLLDWGGDGPIVLAHHANGFCGALWDEVARALGRDFRVFALDARGHGDSTVLEGPDAYAWGLMARDLEAVALRLLEETGQPRIALGLGHSFGGTLTIATASRRPRLFERMLLVDPVIIPAPHEAASALRKPDVGLAERAQRRRHVWADRAEARRFFERKELFASWRPQALDLYVEHALRQRADGRVELKCPGAVESAIFGGAHTFDLFAAAAQVTAPVRMLRAVRGNFPRALFEALASRLGDASIEDVDAGHLVVMEQPDLVVDAARAFCAEGR